MKQFFLIWPMFFISWMVFAAPESQSNHSGLKHQTTFGFCPSSLAGNLSLRLFHEFEKNRSLYDLKKIFINENISSKFYLLSYSVQYYPHKNTLHVQLECPKPLLRVHSYAENWEKKQSLLVENGVLFDSQYEKLLRSDQKLKGQLPDVSFINQDFSPQMKNYLMQLVKDMDPTLKQSVAEIIIDQQQELIFILSVNGQPVTAFLGSGNWSEKAAKLQRITDFMSTKGKIPTLVNLKDVKKVIVKFNAVI